MVKLWLTKWLALNLTLFAWPSKLNDIGNEFWLCSLSLMSKWCLVLVSITSMIRNNVKCNKYDSVITYLCCVVCYLYLLSNWFSINEQWSSFKKKINCMIDARSYKVLSTILKSSVFPTGTFSSETTYVRSRFELEYSKIILSSR